MAARVYRVFGDRVEAVARENPYRLADEVEGVGFKTADRMALAMGFSLSSEFRLQSGLRYALREAAAASGHMYLPLTVLVERARQMLGAGRGFGGQRPARPDPFRRLGGRGHGRRNGGVSALVP